MDPEWRTCTPTTANKGWDIFVSKLLLALADPFQRPEYHCKVREGSCKPPFTSIIYLDFRCLNTTVLNDSLQQMTLKGKGSNTTYSTQGSLSWFIT